jgi:hypothetical protein
LSHSISPFLWFLFFRDRSPEQFPPAGSEPQSSWFLASWVAIITGVSHWRLAKSSHFYETVFCKSKDLNVLV